MEGSDCGAQGSNPSEIRLRGCAFQSRRGLLHEWQEKRGGSRIQDSKANQPRTGESAVLCNPQEGAAEIEREVHSNTMSSFGRRIGAGSAGSGAMLRSKSRSSIPMGRESARTLGQKSQ